MAVPADPNRQNRLIWFILAILGVGLCVFGWYRFIA